MREEQFIRAEVRKAIMDILGYPFYVESIEVDVLPDTIKNICDGIIDAVLDSYCDNCKFYCGREICPDRE